MKIIAYLLLIFFFISCNEKKKSIDVSSKMDEFLTGQAKYFRFNGNVLVAENGQPILQKSYGYADYTTKRLLNDSSVFELASVSKQFTATGILLLVDKGKLKLTDSLRQFFPELPYQNITIWNMLTHTSGLPDYFDAMIKQWDHSKIAFNNDMIAFLAKEKLPVLFPPGTKWEYSNTAYVILATIIEKISGQRFADYMAENIFKPLQMTHTRTYNTRRSLKDTIPNYAFGYFYHDSLNKYMIPDEEPSLSFVIYLDGLQGDGIINSTTTDLLKWDRAVKNHSLLKEQTQQEMIKGQAMMDTATKKYYGFGVGVAKNEFGNIISHSGGWPGYVTYLARNTDKDQTFIVLSNNMSNSSSISLTLQHILAGKDVAMPYEHKAITLDSTALKPFIGKYKNATSEIILEMKDGKLFRAAGGSSIELKPESPVKFFYGDGSDRQLEFEIDENKKIKKAWLISTGIKTGIEKL
ncbi:MAG: serine hydrolase domain-containing protein [Chitinophagaceae bacterium]